MKKIKFDSNHILIGTFLLVTGLVLGITIGMGGRGTFALEGNSQLATGVNATSTNATPVNATSTNATPGNASGTNASRTDYTLYLNNFSLAVESAKPGEKVYVGKMTTGACNSGMSINFYNEENTTEQFTVNVESMTGNPYFIVPKVLTTGTYHINRITLIGLNSNNSTFSKCYDYVGVAPPCVKHNFDVKLKINNTTNKEIKLDQITLSNNKVLVGERVNVTYKTDATLTSMKLVFKDGDKTINANVMDLDNVAYFNIPSTTKAGEYTLTRIVLMSEDGSIVYEKGKNFNDDIKLTVGDNETKTYIYNNSDITEEIIKKLYDDNSLEEITINADDNTLISENLFKLINGTNRKLVINTNNNQIIFNGQDITSPKAIDVAMSTSIKTDEDIPEITNNSIIVNFVSNGNLPGNALVRLKATEKIKTVLGSKKVNVYYYDEEKNAFNTIAENVPQLAGYYEFAISHNSKYILTADKIKKEWIQEEEDNNVVGFRQSNNSYLLWICGALILILIVIIIILVAKNKKEKELGN